MTRIAIAVAALIGLFFVVQHIVLQEHRETTLERKNDIDNAITACSELPWFERLQCDE